ncbi:hypothetical protein [Skermanella stibiiresistens]|nr:hypothetical protein [Skermanella stibiiresistens]
MPTCFDAADGVSPTKSGARAPSPTLTVSADPDGVSVDNAGIRRSVALTVIGGFAASPPPNPLVVPVVFNRVDDLGTMVEHWRREA